MRLQPPTRLPPRRPARPGPARPRSTVTRGAPHCPCGTGTPIPGCCVGSASLHPAPRSVMSAAQRSEAWSLSVYRRTWWLSGQQSRRCAARAAHAGRWRPRCGKAATPARLWRECGRDRTARRSRHPADVRDRVVRRGRWRATEPPRRPGADNRPGQWCHNLMAVLRPMLAVRFRDRGGPVRDFSAGYDVYLPGSACSSLPARGWSAAWPFPSAAASPA